MLQTFETLKFNILSTSNTHLFYTEAKEFWYWKPNYHTRKLPLVKALTIMRVSVKFRFRVRQIMQCVSVNKNPKVCQYKWQLPSNTLAGAVQFFDLLQTNIWDLSTLVTLALTTGINMFSDAIWRDLTVQCSIYNTALSRYCLKTSLIRFGEYMYVLNKETSRHISEPKEWFVSQAVVVSLLACYIVL